MKLENNSAEKPKLPVKTKAARWWTWISNILTILGLSGLADCLEGWKRIGNNIARFFQDIDVIKQVLKGFALLVDAYRYVIELILGWAPVGIREFLFILLILNFPLILYRLKIKKTYSIFSYEVRFVIVTCAINIIVGAHEYVIGQNQISFSLEFPVFLASLFYVVSCIISLLSFHSYEKEKAALYENFYRIAVATVIFGIMSSFLMVNVMRHAPQPSPRNAYLLFSIGIAILIFYLLKFFLIYKRKFWIDKQK